VGIYGYLGLIINQSYALNVNLPIGIRREKMKFNVFPNYKVPIDFVYVDKNGETHIEHIGWIATPDIETLKKDHYEHLELITK